MTRTGLRNGQENISCYLTWEDKLFDIFIINYYLFNNLLYLKMSSSLAHLLKTTPHDKKHFPGMILLIYYYYY